MEEFVVYRLLFLKIKAVFRHCERSEAIIIH